MRRSAAHNSRYFSWPSFHLGRNKQSATVVKNTITRTRAEKALLWKPELTNDLSVTSAKMCPNSLIRICSRPAIHAMQLFAFPWQENIKAIIISRGRISWTVALVSHPNMCSMYSCYSADNFKVFRPLVPFKIVNSRCQYSHQIVNHLRLLYDITEMFHLQLY